MSRQSVKVVSASSQKLTITDGTQTGLDFGTANFTIAGWIKVSTFVNNVELLEKQEYGGTGGQYQLATVTGDKIGFGTFSPGLSYVQVNSTTVLAVDEYVHFAIQRYNSTTIKIFINGIEEASATVDATLDLSGSGDFIVGSGNGGYSNAKFAYLRAWSAALTPAQLVLEMASTKAVKTIDLEADWDFQGDATDASSNGNDLTASGAPTYVNDNGLNDVGLYGTARQCANLINASSQYFSIASDTDFDFGAGDDFEFEFEINKATSAVIQGVFDKRVGANDGYQAFFNTTTLSFQIDTGSLHTVNATYAELGLILDRWIKIKLTKVGTTMSIYADGVLIDSTTHADIDLSMSNSQPLYVGYSGSSSQYFDGKMANLIIKKNGTTTVNVSFDGDATDSSGNSNNLTPVGTPTYPTDADLEGLVAVNGTDYVSMTINSSEVDATLTDFPVFLDLAQITSGDDFWTTVHSTGKDIIVTNSDGTVQYPVEIVGIDTTGKTGQVHFKTPSLSSTVDTDVRVYYDGAEASRDVDATYGQYEVWSDYVGVWHMEEDPSTTNQLDSTGNGYDFVSIGTMTSGDLVAGEIGNKIEYDGSDDGMYSNANIPTQTECTLSGYFKARDGSTVSNAYFNSRSAVTPPDCFQVDDAESTVLRILHRASASWSPNVNSSALTVGNIYKFAYAWKASDTYNLFLDGASDKNGSTTATGMFDGSERLALAYLKNFSSPSYNADTTMDEVRLRGDKITTNWESTEYNNQVTPASFWTYNLPGTEYTETFTEVVTTVDTFLRFTSLEILETAITVASEIVNTTFSRIYTEIVALVDTATVVIIYAEEILESITTNITKIADTGKVVSDTTTLVDTIETAVTFNRIYTETVILVASFVSNIFLVKEFIEQVVTVDMSVIIDHTFGRVFVDTLEIKDTLVGYLNGENMKYADSYSDDSEVYVDTYQDN